MSSDRPPAGSNARRIAIALNAFRNEAKNMRILQGQNKENKNAVILDNCFETNDEFAIVMEKCDNNIDNHLVGRRSFNAEEIYEILIQLNNSFRIMTENKILHRAISPQNIFLNYLNEEKTKYLVKLKITDDSCSSNDSDKLLDSNIDRDYSIYAPEALNENNFKFTKVSDLWSLGVLTYGALILLKSGNFNLLKVTTLETFLFKFFFKKK
jgi:serine/threonine protein kinase